MEEPETLEAWTNFHEMVESLPEKEQDVFGLIWYDDLTQDEAAEVLDVSIRTVKRRWQSARLILAEKLKRSGDGL
jgi:RNA polymerase sigma factor (sigma-70 family)